MRSYFALFIAVMVNTQILAQEERDTFFITGYADVYYGYDFSRPPNNSRQYFTQAVRHNEFNLNWGYLLAEYRSDRIRSNLGFHSGTYVQYNYAAEPNDLTRLIYQANAGVRLFEKLWLDAGIITPHFGYESVASLDNEIYTRALGTELTPYYLTGVKFSSALTEQLDLVAVVVNGWQQITEINDAKSFGVNIQFRPADHVTISYGNLIGDEAPARFSGFIRAKIRHYHNMWARYNLSEQTHLVGSIDFGRQEQLGSTQKSNFTSWSFIASHDVTDKVSLAVRAENFSDTSEILIDAVSADEFDLTTASVTGTYKVAEEALLRLEIKMGEASGPIFRREDGTNTSKFAQVVASVAVRFRRPANRS